METIVSVAVGIVAGGFITWIVSWHYHIQSSKELMKEVDKLRQITLQRQGKPAAKPTISMAQRRAVTGRY